MVKDSLLNLINERRARVGVIGLGYVGLPLVVEFGRGGFQSVGFEVDASKVARINAGESYIPDVLSPHVKELVDVKRLHATTDFSELKDCDAIIICVPTPLRKTKEPDISYILAASEQIARFMRSGQLIILESTTYPGTTDEVLLPMFEERGFHLDKDILLAFSPERVDPGNPQFQTHNIPKVVGGCSKDSTEAAAVLYSPIVNRVHAVSSSRVAEAAKLWENTFRAVNIGMANEMARLCYHLGIDTWEVIRAAATKPFGFMPFYPGPGIGGHCLHGKEMAIVRDETSERVENLAELFEKESARNRVRKFKVHGSDVIYKPNLQTLSVDMRTGKTFWNPIEYLFRRKTDAATVTITTSDNRRVTVTDLHPMLKMDADGALQQVFAKDLQAGDRLPIHVSEYHEANSDDPEIDLLSMLPREMFGKIRVRIVGDEWKSRREILRDAFSAENVCEFIRQDYLPLEKFLAIEATLNLSRCRLRLFTGRGCAATSFPAIVRITPNAARLIGYYLAEGCATREKNNWRIRFSFNRDEKEFIGDVVSILETEFGVRCSIHQSSADYVTHIRVASSLFGFFLTEVLRCGKGSTEMAIPDCLIGAPAEHRLELLKGLLRGDGDVCVRTGAHSYKKNGRAYEHRKATAEVGYFSSSPKLFHQVVYLLQSFGFTPTFKRTKPHLQMRERAQLERVRGWLGAKGSKLQDYFAASRRAAASKTFKRIGELVTVPVKSIEVAATKTPIDVFSVEVEGAHTFATSYGIFVHNCIPLDPHYLSWKARQHGFDSRFISLAEEVNSRMPEHVVQLVADGLNEAKKALNGARVLLLGVAYKKDIDDVRESPALSIIDRLRAKGAEARYHDAFVPRIDFHDAHTMSASSEPLESVELTDEELKRADCVVIVTDHSNVDYRRVCELASLIVDTRNALGGELRAQSRAKIFRL